MGTWKIEISGTGCHHNRGRKDDAERLAAGLVRQLKEAGHVVRGATFTLTQQYSHPTASPALVDAWETGEIPIEGTVEDISDPVAYLAAKETADAEP